MAKVVHFEIPVDNPERAMEFYKKAFNWQFQKFEGWPYWLVIGGGDDERGINGGLMMRDDTGPAPVTVVGVESIDAAANAIEAAGGAPVVPKMPIPGVGWSARFRDPEGNIFGVYEDDPSAK